MSRLLALLLAAFIISSAVACGSSDESGGASGGELADLSEFPTPSGSRATQEATAEPNQASESGPQTDEAPQDATPLTLEELQQIRQRFQSGELTQDEAQALLQRLEGQFGRGLRGGELGGAGGRQIVGVIEWVEETRLTLTTETGSISVVLSDDTEFRVTAVLDLANLAEGTQVSSIVERVEGRNIARTITVIPDDQSGFARFQGGLGGAGLAGGDLGSQDDGRIAPLVGTVENLTEHGFTLSTQQGPLPITTDEESVVVRTDPGTRADLMAGLRVRVTGPSDESGKIDAISVIVIPDGLEDFPGQSRGGFGGGGPQGGGP